MLANVGLQATVRLAPVDAWEAALGELREAPDSPLGRVREICLAFPEVQERLSHGSPTFFVRKKSFVSYEHDHHGDGRLALWCAATHDAQQMLVETNPEQFFFPAYVAHMGWVGIRLDRDPDWDEIAGIVEAGYRKVAPKAVLAQLDGTRP